MRILIYTLYYKVYKHNRQI